MDSNQAKNIQALLYPLSVLSAFPFSFIRFEKGVTQAHSRFPSNKGGNQFLLFKVRRLSITKAR